MASGICSISREMEERKRSPVSYVIFEMELYKDRGLCRTHRHQGRSAQTWSQLAAQANHSSLLGHAEEFPHSTMEMAAE